MVPIGIISIVCLFLFLGWKSYRKAAHPKWLVPQEPFPLEWRGILNSEVLFYASLEESEKTRFEYKVQEFLLNCRITGIKTEVSLTDKLLVASSAIIPIFGFDSWKYTNIREVLLYPAMFDENYQFEGESDRRILGMVGNQSMEGIMILSKEALRLGFKNESDKHNTAIHEFVHLIDKSDGEIDGLPKVLMDRKYALPWIDLMNKEIERIYEGKSDINPYGATNRAEFLSVISEYFFERPKLLEEKHPELYALLEKIFNQQPADQSITRRAKTIGRNDPCVCNSGKKFKHCCGSVHYTKKIGA
ncbi:zinc-dependent peptidase [Fluviicola chungangensis]|uniref:Peptidase n=1 Tax=Fluviicola chungangensis TaxID=2597671 RepID=A0A556N2E9_9FLAO|nr:zinc-dependent peptidase [Fluviicola chungangensis]TSJ46364.1 peptidase [Fluviicola chungangensis]